MWRYFTEEGLAYDFQHGMELETEIPLLHNLQKAYFQQMRRKARRAKDRAAIDEFLQSLEGKRTKVVYASFDPTFHPENQVSAGDETTRLYLSEKNRFTLLLVADDDLEKSVTELEGEKQDLHLLIRLVIRQMLRERVLISTEVANTLHVAQDALEGFTHRLANIDLPEATQLQVKGLADGVKSLLTVDAAETIDEVSFDSKGIDFLRYALELDTGEDEEAIQARLDTEVNGILGEDRDQIVTPNVRILQSKLPLLKAELPREVVAECFRVVFKNAIQAAADPNGPAAHEVTVEVQAGPAGRKSSRGAWLVYIVVENTTTAIPLSRFDKLNSDTPQRQEPNSRKKTLGGSHGYGVYTARQQLRRFLGRGADISYVPVGNERIQARITLPVYLDHDGSVVSQDESEPAMTDEDFSTSGGRYVLYVEDGDEIAKKSLAYLQAILAPHGVATVRASTRNQAQKHLFNQLPLLMITDMSIPKVNPDDDPKAENGRDVVLDLLKHTQNLEERPPVWIVSGDPRDEIHTRVSDAIEREEVTHYLWSDSGTRGTALAEPGLIHVPKTESNNKTLPVLDQTQNLTEALEALVGEVSEPEVTTESSVGARQVELQSKDLLKQISSYLEDHSGQSRPHEVLVLTADARNFKELRHSLSTWFALPPQYELQCLEGDRPRPLYDSSYHNSVVCMFRLPDKVLLRLSPAMHYWGIRHNTLLLPLDTTSEHTADLWARMYRGRTGLLRHIRHQWHSLQNIDAAKKYHNKVIQVVNGALTNHLGWDEKSEKALNAALASGGHDDAERQLAHLGGVVVKQALEDNLNEHRVLRHQLADLETLLQDFSRQLEASMPLREDRGVKLAKSLRALIEAFDQQGVSL